MPEDRFAGQTARNYDADAAAAFAPDVLDPVVDVLAELAGDGAALEFAVGTGRVALPLQARGVPVAGIELSPDMLAQLAAKPGGDAVDVVEGDMTTARVDRRFRLVYLVYSTITNLTTQDAQVACFENAARHLEPGGRFVVECGVPGLRRLPPGETHRVFARSDGYVGFDEYRDLPNQILHSHHWRTDGDTVRIHSAPFRFVWPSELDLMARIAGLRLRHRWSGWDRGEFTATSTAHVSVWERPAS